MSEAPERIYLDGDAEADDSYWTRCFADPKYVSEPPMEFIRADLSAIREAAARREGWNAAIEAAAKVAEEQAEWVPIKQGDMSKAILAMKETDQ